MYFWSVKGFSVLGIWQIRRFFWAQTCYGQVESICWVIALGNSYLASANQPHRLPPPPSKRISPDFWLSSPPATHTSQLSVYVHSWNLHDFYESWTLTYTTPTSPAALEVLLNSLIENVKQWVFFLNLIIKRENLLFMDDAP